MIMTKIMMMMMKNLTIDDLYHDHLMTDTCFHPLDLFPSSGRHGRVLMVMALITLKMMMLTLVRIAIVQVQVLWREERVEKAPSLRLKPSCLQK